MLSLANRDVAETLRAFSEVGVDCTFIVPTQTGLQKSILDATETVRVWFKENHLHDYAAQGQGQDYKVQIEALIIARGEVADTTASLYRPETKSGDPRIWFSRLGQHADPTDLLAICKIGKKVLIVNCSNNDLSRLLSDSSSVFWRIFGSENPASMQVSKVSQQDISEILRYANESSDSDLAENERLSSRPTLRIGNADLTLEALELLSMLKQIGAKGFVPTMRSGDTGVGFTLETLLGIECNSSKSPDYKGIEIKAGRASAHASGRTTIFSQVPDWSISRLKGSKDILRERGRFHEVKQRLQLFHEMSATKINSYGLSLKVDTGNEFLHQIYVKEGQSVIDVTWTLSQLFDRLIEKHKQTFWVKAETQGRGKGEQFHYSKAKYTSGVSPSKFPMLLETGIISLDYTIKALPNGSAKDQGYLFKIKQNDLPLLFKSPQTFDLTN